MPKGGKTYYPNCNQSPGKAKFQGGGSRGKKSSLNTGNRVTPMIKNIGTPKDKGVNR